MAVRRRKNFLPAVFFAFLSWFVVGFFIFLVDPQVIRDFPISGLYLPFFVFLFLSIFLSASFIFSNSRRGLLIALGIVGFFYLRLLGLGHLLNAILLAAFIIVLELAVSKRN
jgi:hypothetical protein